jgi:mRNA interferase RelE/StbE
MFQIEFTATAFKQISKLDSQVQNRIFSALKRLKIRPHAHVKKLVNSPYFHLRVGDYRLLVDIHQGKLLVLVLEVGHRRHIYK